MATLTVIIPTFNEVSYIEDALKSVAFADEIIVVDSFSTDGTGAIARPHVTKFLERKFDNFSNQKNFAIEHSKGDWLLFVDADERLTQALQTEILEILKNPKHSGYKINFPHFFMNRFLYHHSDNVLRLVKRKGSRFSGSVHEKLICEGSVGQLKNVMIHYTYKGFQNYINKKEAYAWFQANQLNEKGKKASCLQLFFKPFFRFIKSYFLKGGCRDGVPGLTIATINAYGVFSRYVKLILLQRGMK